jgi:hypothetical protein
MRESRTNIRRRTREIGVATAAHGERELERVKSSGLEWTTCRNNITDESFLDVYSRWDGIFSLSYH